MSTLVQCSIVDTRVCGYLTQYESLYSYFRYLINRPEIDCMRSDRMKSICSESALSEAKRCFKIQ